MNKKHYVDAETAGKDKRRRLGMVIYRKTFEIKVGTNRYTSLCLHRQYYNPENTKRHYVKITTLVYLKNTRIEEAISRKLIT